MKPVTKPRKPAKHVYHIGDKVRIVEPQLFLRVGYPLSLAVAMEHIRKHHSMHVAMLMDKIRGAKPTSGEEPFAAADWLMGQPLPPAHDGLVRAAAYAWMKAQSFGGKERRIHTEINEALRGRKALVKAKRVVKTGDYSSGSYVVDYDGGYSGGEPPSLSNEKSHVLLEVEPVRPPTVGMFDEILLPVWIEECHVQPSHFDLNETLALMAQREEPSKFDGPF